MKIRDCFAFLRGFIFVPIIMFLVSGFVYIFFEHPYLAKILMVILMIVFFFVLSCVCGLGSLKSSRLKRMKNNV